MLCRQCGYYAPEEAIVCPKCGTLMRTDASEGGGAESIRQGKRAREAVKNRAARTEEEIRRKRRSGASHATVPLQPGLNSIRLYVRDTNKSEAHETVLVYRKAEK